MLREFASNPQFVPPVAPIEDTQKPQDELPISTQAAAMRDLVAPFMTIAEESQPVFSDFGSEDQALITRYDLEPVVTFGGYLKQEADQAYRQLDEILQEYGRFALFREKVGSKESPHVIHIMDGRLRAEAPQRVWINILLFVLTVISVFFTGAQQAVIKLGLVDMASADLMEYITLTLANIWRGYPYALSILAIVIAHEAGHYIMMRRHGLQGTLPYFLPAPIISPFGTLGAAIALNDVLKNRKMLLDIGAAGPIAGFIVTVPIVIFGLATSEIIPLTPDGTLEGNSLFYLFAKIVALGQIYPTQEFDVLLNQVAFAGWTGLLLTTLNMFPLGQLDGGHVMYALFGERARWAFLPVIMVLVGISIWFEQGTWIIFMILLLFVGRFYAVPLNAITPLDAPRQAVAVAALAIFVITFTPLPFYDVSLIRGDSADLGMLVVVGLLFVGQRLRTS